MNATPSFTHEFQGEFSQVLEKKKKNPNINIEHKQNILQEHLCEECKRKFSSYHLLDLHLEEAHSPFFEISLSKNKPGLYKCLIPSCSLRFNGPKERKIHYRESHYISGETEPPYYLHNRKRKQRQHTHVKKNTKMEIE